MRQVIVICTIVLLAVTVTAFSQDYAIDKGSTIAAGTFSFTSMGGDLYVGDDDRMTTIQITPAIQTFVAPNVAIGGAVAYQHQSQGGDSYNSLNIGPTIGFYIGDASNKNYPYLAASIRYQNNSYGSDSISGTDIVFGFGLLSPVRDHLGIVAEVGYHIVNLKHKDWDKSESGNIIALGIGIAGIFY